jgi:hypothetical protein
VTAANVRCVSERWSRDQILELAPDAPSRKAAQGVAAPAKWSEAGVAPGVVWGACEGSGAHPYLACVDLTEPAYKCGCPSRKFPCKHALGLLLLWSADGVPGGAPPQWVEEWLAQRRDRAAVRAAPPAQPGIVDAAGVVGAAGTVGTVGTAERDGTGEVRRAGEAERRAAQREQRVAAGLSELERWLADQIRQGIAGARQAGLGHWDDLTKRLVDAQAPGVAGAVSRLAPILARQDWPGRVLEEYALLHLLAVGHRRGVPGALGDTIRSRVGFPVSREEVLAGTAVRDEWHVLGRRDEEQDRLIARRIWLRGRATGRPALVLSFAPIGQALDASLVTGTCLDAELAFYPGAGALRAQIAARHDLRAGHPPPGITISAALDEVAAALAADPWVESWPVVLADVVPIKGDGWLLGPLHEDRREDSGDGEMSPVDGWPLDPALGTPWRLIAASGGRPLAVAAEWTPRGLVPLSTWDQEGRVVVL